MGIHPEKPEVRALRLLAGTVLLIFFASVSLVIVLEVHRLIEENSETTFELIFYWGLALPFTSIPTSIGWYLFKRLRGGRENGRED